MDRLDEAKTTLDQALVRKIDDPVLRELIYEVAFLQNNATMMEQQVTSAKGRAQEDWQFIEQSDTEAYYGRLQKAREFSRAPTGPRRRIPRLWT